MSLDLLDEGGQLTVHGPDDVDVDMITPAWAILNLIRGWRPPTVEVNNRQTHHGEVPYPVRFVATTISYDFAMIGDRNHLDEVYADPVEGMESNLNYLLTNVFLPQGLEATLTKRSGAQTRGPIQFVDFPVDGHGSTIECTIGIRIPRPWEPVAGP